VLLFGLACWLFALAYLTVVVVALFHWAGSAWGILGGACVLVVAYLLYRDLFAGFSGGEVGRMVRFRPLRTAVWLALLLGGAALLVFGRMEEKAAGPFRMRATHRAEVRAPVSGVLKAVEVDEGGRVTAGAALASLEIPDLAGRLAQKRSEVTEAKAKLRLLQSGARPEELALQRQRVARARELRDQARQEVARRQKAAEAETLRLKEQLAHLQTDLVQAQQALTRARRLIAKEALSPALYREAEQQWRTTETRLLQTEAQLRERRGAGGHDTEAELAPRDKEVAEAEAALAVLEAGPRTEEIASERARLTRLEEEQRSLEQLQSRLRLSSPVAGVVATPRLRQKVGQFFREGDLICEVEDSSGLEAEITLPEQDVAAVKVGQPVEFRVRALPFETFKGRVVRVAPAAVKADKGDAPSSVTVTCQLDGSAADLRPGMTGQAWIACGSRPVGELLGRSVLRFLRTELWW
jgi:multidrug efflux pump subunit AcrA (membrane-fusion protein)